MPPTFDYNLGQHLGQLFAIQPETPGFPAAWTDKKVHKIEHFEVRSTLQWTNRACSNLSSSRRLLKNKKLTLSIWKADWRINCSPNGGFPAMLPQAVLTGPEWGDYA